MNFELFSRCKNIHVPILLLLIAGIHDIDTEHEYGYSCCRDVGLPRLTPLQGGLALSHLETCINREMDLCSKVAGQAHNTMV
jgi:hypothetical protein